MIMAEKWQKDLAVYQDINTTFIIEGNVHDLQPWIYEDDNSCEPISLTLFLQRFLSDVGYDPIVFYNRIDGFSNPHSPTMLETFFRENSTNQKESKPISEATGIIRNSMNSTIRPSAIIVNLANTIVSSPDSLSEEEIEYFTTLMLASKSSKQALSITNDKKPLTNLLFLIVEKTNDIPTWFYLNNPYVRTLSISRPEKTIRLGVIDSRLDTLSEANQISFEERKKILDEFVALSDGMSLVELFGVFTLCHQKHYSIFQVREAIKMFRYGETQSHWDKIDSERIKNISEFLSRRVKGQPNAIHKVSSILTRACLGMSGIQGGSKSRPKGVLFLAGPTGTGKTELAKTIAEFVFGDESFVTRFDMSEYQQSHSDQKLLGAPPGYVGYSDGGQLTNAIKSRPFSVLLFDEIEKAHPSIMDKFLQILEDGRITDSAGETVYFSETLIVFTSNLGVVGMDETGKKYQTITQDMDYDEIEKKLIDEIKDYFKYKIQRPEILNRFGDNFIVFDFIRKEAAITIFDIKLKEIIKNILSEKNVHVVFEELCKERLISIVSKDLSNGGRGIGNLVETLVINPLADVLAKNDWNEGCTITIKDYSFETKELVYEIS